MYVTSPSPHHFKVGQLSKRESVELQMPRWFYRKNMYHAGVFSPEMKRYAGELRACCSTLICGLNWINTSWHRPSYFCTCQISQKVGLLSRNSQVWGRSGLTVTRRSEACGQCSDKKWEYTPILDGYISYCVHSHSRVNSEAFLRDPQ